ncbi:hypothetical protein [Aliterella atlantica]|nr:hypothetical protein [Aliterella atlantica]
MRKFTPVFGRNGAAGITVSKILLPSTIQIRACLLAMFAIRLA